MRSSILQRRIQRANAVTEILSSAIENALPASDMPIRLTQLSTSAIMFFKKDAKGSEKVINGLQVAISLAGIGLALAAVITGSLTLYASLKVVDLIYRGLLTLSLIQSELFKDYDEPPSPHC